MKHKIYLITYREHDFLEGFVYAKKDFNKWLLEHNKARRKQGEIIEYKTEFDIKEIQELI